MSDTQLTVTIGGGAVDDARTVVRALGEVFGAPDELPADGGATVHMATFGSATAVDPAQAAREGAGQLSAPVSVTVQGTPEAVRRASDTLIHAFGAYDEGAASGDQEQERQLLLVP